MTTFTFYNQNMTKAKLPKIVRPIHDERIRKGRIRRLKATWIERDD